MHIAQGILKAINVNRCDVILRGVENHATDCKLLLRGGRRAASACVACAGCLVVHRVAALVANAVLWRLVRSPMSPVRRLLCCRLTRAGCVFKFWVADWFALLNNKMGGDLKKIRTVGQYMVEVRSGGGGRGFESRNQCVLGVCALSLCSRTGLRVYRGIYLPLS